MIMLRSKTADINKDPPIEQVNKQTRGLVSKVAVVLRGWGRETQNFGFTN